MSKNIVLSGLSLMFFVTSLFQLSAQTESDNKKNILATDHLKDLKKGALIVRYPTYNRQINFLSNALNSEELKAGKRSYYQKRLNEFQTLAESSKYNTIKGFNKNYEFSDLYYIPDTLMNKFLESYENKYLIEGTTEKDIASFDRDKIFFCIEDNTSRYSSGTKEAWLIMDYKLETLPNDFPYYVGKRNFIQSFFSIFTSVLNEKWQRDMGEIASRFNEMFYSEYAEMQYIESN